MADHEQLSNLQGGDETGHYHLTREQLDWVQSQQESGHYKPNILDGQVISISAGEAMNGYKIESDRT